MPQLAHTRFCVCVHALNLSFRMSSRARQLVAVVLYETVNVMTRRRLSAARLEMQIIFVASSPPGKSVLLWKKSLWLEWWCPTRVSSAVVWVLSSGLASLAAEIEVYSTREDSIMLCECWMIWISWMQHINVRSFPQHQLVFQFCHRGSFCQSNRSSCLWLMLAR